MLAPELANQGGLVGAITVSSSPRLPAEIIIDLIDAVRRLLAITDESDPAEIIHGQTVAFWRDMNRIQPIQEVERLTGRGGRVLISHGGRDYLVIEPDWKRWSDSRFGKPRVDLRVYANLNHIMQEGEGKMTPEEYAWTRPVSDAWITDVANWILEGN